MLRFSFILILIGYVAVAQSVEMEEYYVDVVKEALASGNIKKARSELEDGLLVLPASDKLKKLKKLISKAEIMRRKKEADKKVKLRIANKKKLEKQAQKRELLVKARTEAREKEVREYPKKLQKTYCDCAHRGAYFGKLIAKEAQIARLSGSLNLTKQNNYGRQQLSSEDTLNLIRKELVEKGIAIPNCSTYKAHFALGSLCIEYLSKNLYK